MTRQLSQIKFGLFSAAVLVAAAALVALTGGTHSPLTFVLFVPVLLAALHGGLGPGLVAGLVMAVLYAINALQSGPVGADPAAVGVAWSFPTVAVCASLLSRRMEDSCRLLKDRTVELSALLDMSQMMDSACDLDMTLNLILLNVQKLTKCHVCAVYLKERDSSLLELRAASGPRNRMALMPSLPVEEARGRDWFVADTSHLGETVTAFYVPDRDRAPRQEGTRLFELDRRAMSFACVPLAGMEGLVGMVYVGFDTPLGLSPDGVRQLEHLATRAAFSLQRGLLEQGVRSLAYSDAMTGLDNFRQFEQNLAQEMSRAERYGHKLSVLLLDIDHFKSFNDRLGHQAGDALLGQLGTVLRNTLRNVDKAARYGGEEFVMICPETGRDEAQAIAERIRRSVAETRFALMDTAQGAVESRGTAHVTVSIGYATFPLDAATARDLVKQADTALYAAKAGGRNAVCGPADLAARELAPLSPSGT